MDATQLLGASADEFFTYRHYANGRTERTPRRGSGGVIRVSPDLEARREPVVVSRPVSFGDLRERSSSLDARLDALESRARKFEEQKPTRDQETAWAWVRDMQKLGAGSYREKQGVHRKQQDAGLSPHEAKAKCQQDLEDDRWVDEMAVLAGDDYEKKRELYRKGGRDG